MAVKDYITLGKFIEIYKQSPTRIRKAIEAAGVKPEFRLNDLEYFDASAIDAVRGHLNEDAPALIHRAFPPGRRSVERSPVM